MVFILLLVAIGSLVAAYLLGAEIRTSMRSRHWPQYPARVLESNITRQHTRIGDLYKVRVRVEYSLAGRRTACSTLPSQFGTARGGYATRLYQSFYEGAIVPVYVNPARPDVAVLLPGSEYRDWLFLGLMIFTAAGAMVASFIV